MTGKRQILDALAEVLDGWEALLKGTDEKEITAEKLSGNWSIKDVIAHLWGWQQISVRRVEAALSDTEMRYPDWPKELDPEREEDLDKINEWIYSSNRDKPWHEVYTDWKAQFLRYLELAEQLPEKELMEPNRYTWLGGYSVYDSLAGSQEHHAEHLEDLVGKLS